MAGLIDSALSAMRGDRRASVPGTGALLGAITRGLRGGGSYAPSVIDDHTAMTHDAVYACVRSITKPISIAPIQVIQGDEFAPVTTANIRPTPQVLRSPSPDFDIDRIGWISGAIESMLLRGMAWGMIRQFDRGVMPAQVELLDPDVVSVRRDANHGPVRYFVDGVEMDRWPRGPLWGAPLYPPPGSPIGVSAITHGARQIATGLAEQGLALDTYNRGAHPTGILSSDTPLRTDADATKATETKERFMEAVANREVAYLGAGLTFKSVQLSVADAQLLEAMGANVPMVCRLFDVRPERIGAGPQSGSGAGGSITYANLADRQLHHLTEAVTMPARALAASLSTWLPRGKFVRFDLNEQVVLDALTQARVNHAELTSGMIDHGEGRARLGREPIPGVDPHRTGDPGRHTSLSISAATDSPADALDAIDGEA